MGSRIRIELGGQAVVCCVHDRQKRVVVDPDHVRFLGRAAGVLYDPTLHKLQLCACCQNLFVTVDDTPRFCPVCSGGPVHALAHALPEPTEGRIDG